MVKVRVSFRQHNGPAAGKSLVKEIDLAAIPVPGSLFEYEPGIGSTTYFGNDFHLKFCKHYVEIYGYGPQFDAEELKALLEIGWVVQ